MADLSDVENAVMTEIVNALYPSGTGLPSVVGATCRVYRGWPVPASLNSDLAAGVINVTVFPTITPDEVPDAYFDVAYANLASTSLVATVSAQSVAFSGLATVSQVVGLLIDGTPYAYIVNESDTTESIAANLTALIVGDRLAILSGSTITVPNTTSLIARAVTNGTVSWSLRRQRREIQISCWCPSSAQRDSVASAVDLALSETSFISLSDGTKAHVRYTYTKIFDQAQNVLLYRRDLCYKFEYTMIGSAPAPVMLFGNISDNGGRTFV